MTRALPCPLISFAALDTCPMPFPAPCVRRLTITGVLLSAMSLAGCGPRESDPQPSPASETEMPSMHGPDPRHDVVAPPVHDGPPVNPDVIYIPTPQPVVDAMLELANVGPGDVLYDLGSGDGRIPISAAQQHGIAAIGIDIDSVRIAQANANAQAAGVAHRATFVEGDMFDAFIGDATVVTLYLLQRLNVELRPKLLRELRPGTRIVSHAFDMADTWPPEQTVQVHGATLYLWTVPEPSP